MSQNPFSESPFADNPYLAPTHATFQPGEPLPEEMRGRALAKVAGPAILMMVYGVLVTLGSAMLLSIPFFVTDEPDRVAVVIGSIACAAFGMAVGVFTIVTAVWMKRLQGWGWALASVVLYFGFALLVCPLFIVAGVWPLVVLLDSGVRACFNQPVVPYPPQQQTPPGPYFG